MDQLSEGQANGPGAVPDGAIGRSWEFPLSFSQQRLWLLEQLEPGNTSYSIPWSIRLTGLLDREALERSLNQIVQRHETLRTTFKAEKGEPFQVVAESLTISLPLLDVAESGAADLNAEAARIARQEARRPIDLENGPLVRACLLRLADYEHILLLTLHHIVFDGWSRRVLARELAILYAAFREGKPSPLPELRLQYADYVVWQRKHLKGKALEKQLAYWKTQLAGAPASLNLPTDRPRPPIQSYRGTALPVHLSAGLSRQLADFSRESGASLFMVLLAGFQTILARYSGEQDIVVGTPIAGRTRAETEELIGLFANTLVLRGDLSGDPAFSELVSRIKRTALDGYAHQDVPFEKLVEELNPERSLSHNPLFQVMFSLQNAARQPFELSGLELTPLEGTIETAKFDISVFLSESGEGLRGRIEYNTDLFERATMERLWGHYETLLGAAVEKPWLRLSELPLLTVGERRQVLYEWNNTAAEYPRQLSLPQWFEQQAAGTPQAIACEYEGERLSYGELNARANQMAHWLLRLGIGRGQRVGIYVERSLRMLAGLLAIQKTGAAYVPLDPGYPAERIAHILEAAQVAALVTEAALAPSLPASSERRICLDAEWDSIRQQSRTNPPASAQPEEPVYVIFTSGSTGRPKGVEVPHRAVVNLLASMARELRMGPGDVFPALASFAFDMCIPELYLALVTGGCVALGGARLAADGAELAAFLRRVGATVVHATPTSWRLLLEAGFTGAGLKRAIGAEALPPELCRRLLEAEACLYNFYGPTETTVWSTLHVFRSPAEPVVVGRPLANTQTYILDRHRQPVPVGVEGELYIGGEGVARGYLGQPELTAERFLPNPFVGGDSRMYRTGDRARYRADGRIEFLGRADFQVKLRGYRIELGEIEAVLVQHPAVAQCVAAVREDSPGDQRLVAYVVRRQAAGAAGASPGAGEEAAWRSWVKERLPEYMVPVRVVAVESFALTPNGKVDRQRLPQLDYRRVEGEQGYQAARTPLEELLSEIWAAVLKLDRVGVEDDFFQLGGHSLLGTQVVSRVRQALPVELPLRALFEAPTVRGLAQRVEALRRGPAGRSLPPLERRARPSRIPLSFAQQRLWFLDQLEPGNVLYNVPYLVRWTGRLELPLLEQSLNELVRRHEVLRTRFVLLAEEDEPAQLIDEFQPLPLQRVALGDWPAGERVEEARRRVLAEIQQPFDLARGPLLRATVFVLDDQDHIFVLNTHHIISDRWSLGVFAEELAALYEAARNGQPSPLPELPVQYADYALWQRQWLNDQALAPQLEFWKQHLHGAPSLLDLPTDRPRSSEQTTAGAQLSDLLPKPLADGLKELSHKEGATLFMTVLAAFNLLLARYSGQQHVVVGTPIAGRNRTETERLFGFFVNTLALHTDANARLSFIELLRQVRESVISAYAHQDVPFDKLVEELKPERAAGRNPIFQVMLMVQNTGRLSDRFGELHVSPFPVQSQTAKFELTLIVTEAREGLRFTFEYRTDLLEAATIQRMQGHLRRILEVVIRDPAQAIGEIDILSKEERSLILHEWNKTTLDYPRQACLPDLLRPVAWRHARKTALIFGGQHLTYAQLEERSNRFANYLRLQGVGPEQLVGLFARRSIDMVVALFGILKAGAAYVPIDPGYPKDRIAFILEDAQIALLATEQALSERLPTLRVPRIYLDADLPAINDCDAVPPSRKATSDNLAYIIYTSGSTGRPKGVQVTNRNLVNFLLSMQAQPGVNEGDVLLALTSLSFDIAALELYLPLITGAKIVIASREEALDGRSLVKLMDRAQPTMMQATPASWRMLIEAGWDGNSRLKALCGGEALDPELARELLPRCRELWNMYGPTETTVWSSLHHVGPTVGASVPVGRGIANTALYVLDEHRQPVPVGVIGELYIGGDGVARGYLNRPELDAERFLPDPFAGRGRIYRTGDLAKFLPDGNVMCLGRTDNQVKIRGHRIELGEIEACLLEHADIKGCAVVAREDVPGDKRLVAYYVGREHSQVSPGTLRSYLHDKLPQHFAPALYIQLDSLPLTTSGKINRAALPKPSSDQGGAPADTCYPRDEFEVVLLQVWRRVLGIESCGMTDNFFELGGHSLLLIRLATQIEKEFGKVVPTALLFESPTIEKIAAFLRGSTGEASGFFVPFNEKGSGPTLFLVHSVIGDVVGCRHLVRLLDPQQRAYGIQVPLHLRTPEFASSVQQIAERYVDELLAFEPEGPYILGGWSAGAPIALEMAQQLAARNRIVPLLVSIDAAPANTGGATRRSNPLYLWKLLCNLPRCLKNDVLMDFSWRQFARRFKRRSSNIIKAWRLKRSQPMALVQHRIDAFLAGGEYSESARSFMGALYLALQRYVPKPYPFPVLLYKVRAQSLLRLKEVDRKWKQIASDLEVVPVGGNHVTVMLGKHVEWLAKDLNEKLAKIRQEHLWRGQQIRLCDLASTERLLETVTIGTAECGNANQLSESSAAKSSNG